MFYNKLVLQLLDEKNKTYFKTLVLVKQHTYTENLEETRTIQAPPHMTENKEIKIFVNIHLLHTFLAMTCNGCAT